VKNVKICTLKQLLKAILWSVFYSKI